MQTAEIKTFRGDIQDALYNDTESFTRDGYADLVITRYREALTANGYTILTELRREWTVIDEGFRSLVADFEVVRG